MACSASAQTSLHPFPHVVPSTTVAVAMEPIDIQETPPDEPETSRSADTIRQIPLHAAGHFHTPAEASMSPPDSPHLSPHSSPAHSAYPSPSSPSGESVSSLPSVSSSFLFSSGIGSSPHLGLGIHHDAHDHGLGDSSLIIPSLTLPSAVRRPTPYGQTLGDVRLLIWGAAGSGAEEVAQVIADEECEDIVEVGQWTDLEPESDHSGRAKVLRLSTDWIEHRDAHGLEKHEPSRNVEVVLLKDYGPDSNVSFIPYPSVTQLIVATSRMSFSTLRLPSCTRHLIPSRPSFILRSRPMRCSQTYWHHTTLRCTR